MAASKTTTKKLNPNQELFCKLYAEPGEYFGNGTQAYIEAYGVDLTKKGAYAAARVGAYDNLTKPNILAKVRELLEMGPLNEEAVDKELAFVITQSADLSSKVSGIREYNRLKARITEKTEAKVIHKFEELPDDELDRIIKAREDRLSQSAS